MRKKSRTNRFEVARVLEQAILSGRFRPGDRLPEMRIAQVLGVSQASVREALQDLEGLGLAQKNPNRGSIVTQLSGDDLAHIYQIRRELEPLACGLAASHLSGESLTALQDCVNTMRDAAERVDFADFLASDVRFHRTIWRAQPNRFLEKSLQAVCLPLFAFDLISRKGALPVSFDHVIRQHQLIVDVLRSKDVDLVVRVTRRMVARWLRQDLADYDWLIRNEAAADIAGKPSVDFLSEFAKSFA